jgi:glutathione S-transferase
VLEEIGAEYELLFVDRANGQHKSAPYLKLNPSGRIPVLIDGGLALFETAAICLHLADRHPEAGLAPKPGSTARAQFYKWLMYLATTLQTELITYFYPERLADDAAATAQVKRRAEERVGGMLDILEAELAGKGKDGAFLAGEAYSLADIYLMMLCRWTRGMARPAAARPHLARHIETVAARPAIQRTFAAEGIAPPYFTLARPAAQ